MARILQSLAKSSLNRSTPLAAAVALRVSRKELCTGEAAAKRSLEECSLSQALHRLISVALERYPLKRKSSFARFAGRWTAEEAVAFNELTQRTVDEEDWK